MLLRMRRLTAGGLLVTSLACAPRAFAKSAAGRAATGGQSTAPAAGTRLLGTVTSISADSLTLKLETGGEVLVSISPQTKLVRTAPGEKTLAGATMIHVEDLATGDRVLVRALPGPDATHYTASAVIAMKQADIAQVHASEAEDWQKRGVGGVVKSIAVSPGSAGGASITVGGASRPLAITITPATIIRRYAPNSVNFADTKPAAMSDIQVGDQVRARGDRSADGSTVAAVEIVAGSFRNIAGTITTIDAAHNTLTLTDLATKKPVTLRFTADTQMRKLPPEMAQRLAARSARAGNAAGSPASSPAAAGGLAAGSAGGAEAGEARPHSDPASMLQRAPTVTLAELKKGDAVMIVATRGTAGSDAGTAVTLIAGVEPLLQGSSAASDSLFSASWNMGGGAAAETQQ